MDKKNNKEFDWFDRPSSRRLLWIILWTACAVSLLAEIPLFSFHLRHAHFEEYPFEGWFAFYAAFGFLCCVIMIVAAKGLGKWLKKNEDYYGDETDNVLPDDIDESLR